MRSAGRTKWERAREDEVSSPARKTGLFARFSLETSMALETKLVQKLSQTLLMTPQLQQAIKLLQLGRLEYLEAIEKELLENPLLEELKEATNAQATQGEAVAADNLIASPAEPTASDSPVQADLSSEPASDASPQAKVDWEDYLENFTDYRGSATPKGLIDYDERPSAEASLTREETLADHLLNQIRLADLAPLDRDIAACIVGNLDKNGYLCMASDEIAQACGRSMEDVERVIEFVRSLDPPGVAARNLKECLALQLDSQGRGEGLEARIILNHLDKLERRRFDLIAKAEQVALEEVYKAVTAIKKLEPRPGRPFADDATRYVVPDVYVYKVGNDYVISLNEDGMPKLRVSPYYLRLLRAGDADNLPNREYLNERLKAASWLIRSILQRQQTIYKVAESIVKFQREFLDHGISRLRPLTLKDVADDIKMHESTVSRVTISKYIHTPQGVFELKFFFSTAIKTIDGDVSASSIKERIRSIIAAEPENEPISDQGIVEILKKENVPIARRTVAKYRESLGFESSSRRKKLF